MTTDAYRACSLCGTRNPYYMLVCRHCGRSLRGVGLVGSPPPGVVVEDGSPRGLRVALGLLALVGATAAAVLAVKLLRPASFEAAAAAAPEPSPTPEAVASHAGWETLEQRLADLPPAPPPPDAPATTTAPPPTTAPPAPATPRPTASPSTAAVPPDVRSERRAALRAAERRLRALERRADELRDALRDAEASGAERAQLEDDLASVQLQLQDAERELLRAEWALREVEPR